MKPKFESYVGIDYSGAGHCQTRTGSLRVYGATKVEQPVAIESLSSSRTRRRNWNRLEIYRWIDQHLATNRRVVVGIDHGFSFPISYFTRYRIKSWNQFLADFVAHWPTHEEKVTVDDLRSQSSRSGDSSEFRLAEQWTSSAKSVFQFDVQGSVAKSTHCGIPFLAQLRNSFPQLHFWPFDGFAIPENRSVIAEVYPSLFRNRYERGARSVDEQDAYSVCRWLRETDRSFGLDRYFQPPLTESQRKKVELEGWILGVT